MSFCCGAGMIGTKGTLKQLSTRIHNVPLLFCPVCKRTEVHYLFKTEYEILADYASEDEMEQVDFQPYVDARGDVDLSANCTNDDDERPMDIVRSQIDMSLDLLVVAKRLEDTEWEEQLKLRLSTLSIRYEKLLSKNRIGGPR